MTQVNHGKSDVVTTEKVGILAIKTDQQSAKLVNPGETAFTGKALLVHLGIEEGFASAFGRFAVTFVLGDVGDHRMIETNLATVAGVEGTIRIEERPGNGQPQAFEGFEGGLKVGFQTKSVVMIACHDTRRSDDKAVGIGDGQNIAGFGPLTVLIGHAFTAFLSQGMATI